MIEKNCLICNKKFRTKKSHVLRGWGVFCSISCAKTGNKNNLGKERPDLVGNKFCLGKIPWNKGIPRSEETKKKISESNKKKIATLSQHWNKGRVRTEEMRKKISDAQKGKRVGEKNHNWNGGVPNCIDCGKKLSAYSSKRCHKCNGAFRQGDKNPCWRGGTTEASKLIRNSSQYVLWRIAVFARDKSTCQACGVRGKKMVADHELPFALYPELRLEVLNGRTLCEPCHRKIPANNKHWKLESQQ